MSVAYRPRGVPELIDAAFQLMRRNYVALLVLAAATYLPTFAVVTLISAPAAMSGNPNDMSTTAVVALFALSPLLLAWYAVGVGAMIAAASDAYQGTQVDPGTAIKAGFRRFWPIVLASLAKWILIMLAASVAIILIAIGSVSIGPFAVLLAIPACAFPFMVWARFFAVPAVTILENLGVGDSLRRSAELSAGFRWRIFGTFVVVYLIVFAIMMTAMMTAMFTIKNLIIAQIASNLFSLLAFPLLSTLIVVLYYDLRIRKEGYDLELMQRELPSVPAGQPV